MTAQTIATQVGILVQLAGAGYLVFQAARTARVLRNFGQGLTFDKFNQSLERLSGEVASQFKQQLVGFVFIAVGSALQLYGAS